MSLRTLSAAISLASAVLLTGCGTLWPSFKDRTTLPAFDGYPVVATLAEAGDFGPPDCRAGTECPEIDWSAVPLIETDEGEALGLFQAARIDGHISPDPSIDPAEPTWDFCGAPPEEDGLSGFYRGDIDMFRVKVDADSLCLVLSREDPPNEPEEWDATVFRFNGGEQCMEDPYLSTDAEGSPAAVLLPGWSHVTLGEPGTFVVVIAHAIATAEESYRVHVLPRRDSELSCTDPVDGSALTAEDFEE